VSEAALRPPSTLRLNRGGSRFGPAHFPHSSTTIPLVIRSCTRSAWMNSSLLRTLASCTDCIARRMFSCRSYGKGQIDILGVSFCCPICFTSRRKCRNSQAANCLPPSAPLSATSTAGVYLNSEHWIRSRYVSSEVARAPERLAKQAAAPVRLLLERDLTDHAARGRPPCQSRVAGTLDIC